MKTKTAARTKGSASPAKSTGKRSAREMDKKEQKSTNGGSILGDDNNSSTLGLGGALGVHSSHTDDDGDTTSNSLGGNFGTGILSANNSD